MGVALTGETWQVTVAYQTIGSVIELNPIQRSHICYVPTYDTYIHMRSPRGPKFHAICRARRVYGRSFII